MFAEINKNAENQLPFVSYTAGASVDQKNIYRPAGLNAHEFIWVTSGHGLFTVNGEERRLGAGEGVFIRRDIPHQYEGTGYTTLWFTFLGCDSMLDFLHIDSHLFFAVPPSLPPSFAELYCALQSADSTLLMRSALGYRFAVELLDELCAPRTDKAYLIRQYLEKHYSEPLTLDIIAAEVGMDRYSLCRFYRESRGRSVMDELRRIRLKKAKRMLRYSDDSVERIGMVCGFDTPSYFIKRFREEVGCTPLAYRKDKLPKKEPTEKG
jgi:AraC-like DNA-binding protein